MMPALNEATSDKQVSHVVARERLIREGFRGVRPVADETMMPYREPAVWMSDLGALVFTFNLPLVPR
jgi:hypothetical protein